jgi:H+/gluconate symporter-like permease
VSGLEEAGAIAVKSTTGLFTAVGIWTGLIATTGAVIIAFIKFGPRWRDQAIEQRSDEMGKMSVRIATLEKSVEEANKASVMAEERAHKAELSMSIVVAVMQLLMSEVEKLDPEDNKTLRQAREMISSVMAGDFGMNAALTRLATIPSVPGKPS